MLGKRTYPSSRRSRTSCCETEKNEKTEAKGKNPCFISEHKCENNKIKCDLGHSATFQSSFPFRKFHGPIMVLLYNSWLLATYIIRLGCITFYSSWQQDQLLVCVDCGDLREKSYNPRTLSHHTGLGFISDRHEGNRC